MAKGFNLKKVLKGAVDSTVNAVSKADLSGVVEKIQETGESAMEAAKKVKLPEMEVPKIKNPFIKGKQTGDEEAAQASRDIKEKKHTIVQLSGTRMKILLPDGYERLKHKNPIKDAANSLANNETAYRKTVASSDNIIMIFKSTPDKAMNPDDTEGLIDGIHQNMSDTQGIIEVRNGETPGGYKYIYSIVKNLSAEEFGGVRYFLRLNLFSEKDIIEIQADFTEIGTTGGREAVCVDLASRAGLADVFRDGYKDWMQDPYDPDYTKGCLKNLAEKEGLDGLFPENPLSQAHEFLLAVLKDELVEAPSENDQDEASQDEESLDIDAETSKEEKTEKEMLLGLFVDECRRHTFSVNVERPKIKDPEKGNAEESSQTQEKSVEEEPLNITAISTRNAIKIIYYLMAADGQIFHSEEEKFDSIGQELDPDFKENKDSIIRDCQSQLDKVANPEDYYDALQAGVEEALLSSKKTADTFITPKLLAWDLLTIAYSDENYDDKERKLLQYFVRKTNIDDALFLEMESSILTLMDIEKELNWIKTTSKPYLTIEAMVNELADRKNVIFESVKDLISL